MRPVVWSDDARRDYLEILRFIAGDNPLAAERVAAAIKKVGQELGEFATGRPGRVRGAYEKLVPRLPFIIAYALTTREGREAVSILRIIHTARNWQTDDWPQ